MPRVRAIEFGLFFFFFSPRVLHSGGLERRHTRGKRRSNPAPGMRGSRGGVFGANRGCWHTPPRVPAPSQPTNPVKKPPNAVSPRADTKPARRRPRAAGLRPDRRRGDGRRQRGRASPRRSSGRRARRRAWGSRGAPRPGAEQLGAAPGTPPSVPPHPGGPRKAAAAPPPPCAGAAMAPPPALRLCVALLAVLLLPAAAAQQQQEAAGGERGEPRGARVGAARMPWSRPGGAVGTGTGGSGKRWEAARGSGVAAACVLCRCQKPSVTGVSWRLPAGKRACGWREAIEGRGNARRCRERGCCGDKGLWPRGLGS